MNFADVVERVKKCCDDRDWDRFHDPKSLACDIAIESAEVLEHFRFLSAEESIELLQNPQKRAQVEAELADIVFGLARFAQLYKIDLGQAVLKKITEIESKYPVDKAKGSNKKYNELETQ
ncbi:MAG: nucleotide pyrophosphohydrolase [Bdellovibrionales bacterium]